MDTRKTKSRATAKIEVEQAYIDQLKGTIAQLERKIENMRARIDGDQDLESVLKAADWTLLLPALLEEINTYDVLGQEGILRALVHDLRWHQVAALRKMTEG